jgi:hypothetical protein
MDVGSFEALVRALNRDWASLFGAGPDRGHRALSLEDRR